MTHWVTAACSDTTRDAKLQDMHLTHLIKSDKGSGIKSFIHHSYMLLSSCTYSFPSASIIYSNLPGPSLPLYLNPTETPWYAQARSKRPESDTCQPIHHASSNLQQCTKNLSRTSESHIYNSLITLQQRPQRHNLPPQPCVLFLDSRCLLARVPDLPEHLLLPINALPLDRLDNLA